MFVAGRGDSFDITRNEHAIWVENPSASGKIEVEAETYLFSVQACKFVQEATGNYDPQSPCTIKLSRVLNYGSIKVCWRILVFDRS